MKQGTITKENKSFSTSLANDFQEIIRIVPFPTKMSGCEDSPNLDNLMDAHTFFNSLFIRQK